MRRIALCLCLLATPALAQKSNKPSPPKKWTYKALKVPFAKPWWAAEASRNPGAPRDKILGFVRARNALDDDGVIESIRLLHDKLKEDGSDQWAPLFMYYLGITYEWREFYPEAFHWFKKVAQLDAGANLKLIPDRFPRSMSDMKASGMIGCARVCAKAKLRRNASKFLAQLKMTDPYLLSLTGEVYDQIKSYKQSDSAYRVATSRARYPKSGFGPTHPGFIRLIAVRMAFKHDNYAQAKSLGQSYVNRKRESFRWPQEKTVWDNIKAVLDQIESNTKINLKRVKDGRHEATAMGWSKPITMAVEVKRYKIVKVLVVKHEEERAFNSFTVIPDRVVRAQSTKVDIVSEATATVYGILAAIEKALTQKSALRGRRR